MTTESVIRPIYVLTFSSDIWWPLSIVLHRVHRRCWRLVNVTSEKGTPRTKFRGLRKFRQRSGGSRLYTRRPCRKTIIVSFWIKERMQWIIFHIHIIHILLTWTTSTMNIHRGSVKLLYEHIYKMEAECRALHFRLCSLSTYFVYNKTKSYDICFFLDQKILYLTIRVQKLRSHEVELVLILKSKGL